MASSTHWRREVGKDTSLQYHMVYNPITNKIDFTLFRFGSTWQDREVVGKFPLPFASVIHMFSVTENFAVVAVYPVSFDFMAMPTHNMHAFETLVKKDAPTNFFLINLNDGSVIDGLTDRQLAARRLASLKARAGWAALASWQLYGLTD